MAGLFDGLKKGVKNLLDKTNIDEKIVETAKGLKDKAVDTFNKVASGTEKAADAPKDVMSQIKAEVDDQVSQIRSAATGTNSIHDYIQNKYHSEAHEAPAAAPEAPAAPAAPAEAEAPAGDAPVGLQSIVDHAQAAAAKVTDASVRAQEMVGEKLQDISERAQAAYDQVREDIAQTVANTKADAAETVEAAEAAVESVGDKLEGAAGAIAGAAAEKAAEATEAIKSEARTLGESVSEAVTGKVEAAVEAAHSTVLEGPTAETLSEVFETKQPEAPAPEHPHEA